VGLSGSHQTPEGSLGKKKASKRDQILLFLVQLGELTVWKCCRDLNIEITLPPHCVFSNKLQEPLLLNKLIDWKSKDPLKVETFGHSSSRFKLGFIQSSSACIPEEPRSHFVEVHFSVDGFLVPGIYSAARQRDKSKLCTPMKFRSQQSPLQPI